MLEAHVLLQRGPVGPHLDAQDPVGAAVGCARRGAPPRLRDPEAAVRACFGTVFATSMIRVAYGAGFATTSPVDDEVYPADLAETAVRYLLAEAG